MKTKQRNNPKRHCNYQISNTTLDVRHKAMLDTFIQKNDKIDNHKTKLQELEEKLSKLNDIPRKELTDNEIKEITILRCDIERLQKALVQIQTNKDEVDYFVNTSEILFNYYDLLENHTDEASIPSSTSGESKSIARYFTNDETDETTPTIVQEKNTKTSRFHLLDDYLKYTDSNYINNNLSEENNLKCSFCKGTNKDILVNEGIICCRDCHTVENIITDNEKPSYKDPPKEISYFSYKRINHFSEWLNQIQGKETTDIPEEVFNKIMLELNKQRIYNLAKVTPLKIREILKKNKVNKYYEHIPYILNKITGIPNPLLNTELEDKLKNMFKEIQVPFLKYSPNNRKNFLSYSYVLHKFIQILGKTEFLKHFPLLKSRDKLHQQEQIWKNICMDLNWKFIRSI